MHAEEQYGRVAAGRRADLAVLEGNPLDDIRNVARIRTVVRDGKVFDRVALDALLRSIEIEARASKPRPITLDTSYAGIVSRANGALDAQQWTEAIDLFQKALATNPCVADQWYGLGRAFYNSGKLKESIVPFQRAVELGAGRRYNAAWNIARAFAREGQRDEAMKWLARSLELGFRSREAMRQDPEFEKYRNDPQFKQLTDSVDVSKLSKADGRKHDVDLLIAEVRRMHKDSDHRIAFAEFERKANDLIPRAATLTDNEFAVGVQRALATLGSAHSGTIPEAIPWWGDKAVPLQFFDFVDGLRIVAADSAYADLVGAQVMRAATADIARVRAAIDSITSKDHPLGYRASFTRWLRYPQLLNGLGINPTADTLPLTVVTVTGETRGIKVPVKSTGEGYLRFGGRPDWIQAHVKLAPQVPLYLRNRERGYTFTLLPADRAIYFQFNSVRNDGDEPLNIFVQRMFETADSARSQRLVIDLRWNYGGNTALLTPLVRAVMARERFVRRGGLFVIIGRITNSAAQNAVTLLERYANPILVGEVTASSPNFVGEDNFITLPYTKIGVSISDLYWQTSWPQDERIWTAPLLYTPPTWDSYRRGIDPAMEAIRRY
jgi:tetratricopeptide (TPR) repeat protein